MAIEVRPPCGSSNLTQTCEPEQARAIAPYAPDDTGASSVVLPQRCAQAKAADRCCLFIDHHRHRKTGPCFRLAVVGCSRHPLGGRYTLYPFHT